ncbi:hypothetical protein AA313_de0209611 [Arthrobotrys entomopaga]|nr:hypothetical protein AA313_de0209611 [Arthrobotrys entomopaga]
MPNKENHAPISGASIAYDLPEVLHPLSIDRGQYFEVPLYPKCSSEDDNVVTVEPQVPEVFEGTAAANNETEPEEERETLKSNFGNNSIIDMSHLAKENGYTQESETGSVSELSFHPRVYSLEGNMNSEVGDTDNDTAPGSPASVDTVRGYTRIGADE